MVQLNLGTPDQAEKGAPGSGCDVIDSLNKLEFSYVVARDLLT
jgi:hypothetical protein